MCDIPEIQRSNAAVRFFFFLLLSVLLTKDERFHRFLAPRSRERIPRAGGLLRGVARATLLRELSITAGASDISRDPDPCNTPSNV